MSKKKKWERLFCILIANHLFYYKSQNDAKPTQVINLLHYKVVATPDKKTKTPYGLIEIVPDGGKEKEVLVHKAESDRWHKQWFENLQKTCEEARIEFEEKKNKKVEGSSAPKVFNTPLEQQVSIADGSELPKIVPKCIQYIEERGTYPSPSLLLFVPSPLFPPCPLSPLPFLFALSPFPFFHNSFSSPLQSFILPSHFTRLCSFPFFH